MRELHHSYRVNYQAYYARYADAQTAAIRRAVPAIMLVPGIGMFSLGKDKQTARVADDGPGARA